MRLERGFRAAFFSTALTLILSLFLDRAGAQEAPASSILSPGDAVITGFAGVTPPVPPLALGVDPLDETFINLGGPSMQIQHLQPNGPPAGQLIPSPTTFTAHARDVGQVFAIALDDAPAPNIYLGATSVFGINIVLPQQGGGPQRVKTGQPGAQFMGGQWGTANAGAPGSIYKVDGATGAISLFTTIGANAGPGIGDIVYDRASRQFFVSDLDTGLIYRLDATGAIVDTFDHGVAARPAKGLAPVADDGSAIDVTNPAFNSEDPATWGYTQKERMVWGMAVHGGRLYYAVADGPQVWSVGINLDGSFAPDARWELDVSGLASTNPVSDIAFDNFGRMILAQRGAQRGSYDYSVFAEPLKSSVVRYTREVPDNPATPGTWVPVPEEYAIGYRPPERNTDGGIALGYGYDAQGHVRPNSCGEFLWTTGESLRDNPALAVQLAAGGPATVDGLQGNDHNLVKPANDPPFQSYFTDYDGNFDHPEHQGWMGDVEIWQPCQGAPGTQGYVPPGYGPYIPPYLPPGGYTPPPAGSFNLSLHKSAEPHACVAGGLGWLCSYTIEVTNTGTTMYWGPVTVHDWLPGAPAGAVVTFGPQPPWICAATGPFDYQCDYPPVALFPGESVILYVTVDLPAAGHPCYLDNAAQIVWPFGHGDANPGDDIAFAGAQIPDPACTSHGNQTNLKIEKKPHYDVCELDGAAWFCGSDITVTNVGPGVYSGPIQLTDTVSVPNPIDYGSKPEWTCAPPAGGTYTCDHTPVTLNVGEQVHLWIGPTVPGAEQAAAGRCTIEDTVHITQAPGGSDQNTDPTDDTASAEGKTPGPNCERLGEHSDLSITKHAAGLASSMMSGPPALTAAFSVTVTNQGPDPFTGPLTIHEAPSPVPVPPPFFGGGFWTCVPSGGGYDCTLNPGLLPIAPGASVTLPMSVVVPADSQVCTVDNTAAIVVPAGGTDANSDPTNDSAGPVTAHVPLPACGELIAGVANLEITKTADGHCATTPGGSFICGWTVDVKNGGPGGANGPMTIEDKVPNGLTATFASAVPHSCSGAGPTYTCTFNQNLSAGSDFQFHVQVQVPQSYVTPSVPGALEAENKCHIPNQVAIAGPLGPPNNGNPADDHAEATAHIDMVPVNIPTLGGAQMVPCDPPSLKIEKVADPDQCTVVGSNVECSFTITLTSTGPDPYHGPLQIDEMLPSGATVKSVSPPWSCSGAPPSVHCSSPPVDLAVGESRQVKVTISLGQDFAKRQQCAIIDKVQATVSAQALLSKIAAQYNAMATAHAPAKLCAPTPQACPVAQRMPNGGCCPDGQKWNGRTCSGQPPPRCPQGYSGTPPNCTLIITRQCPAGTHGTPPNCVADTCPQGYAGTPPHCTRIVRPCPSGTHGTPPNCVADTCPQGFTGTPPHCARIIVRQCPAGTHGTPPNCVADTCPQGYAGTPPHCTRIVRPCPSGTHGTPPNCVPNKCPQGYTGTPPNCRLILTRKAVACPLGFTGTPPNCRRITCSTGTHLSEGKCVPNAAIE